jgi:ammonia channel protein AmtB
MVPKALHCQLGIAAVFFVLGGWAMLFPIHVMETVLRPDYYRSAMVSPADHSSSSSAAASELSIIFMRGFGAQACLSGLFAATARFESFTFCCYGAALLPFFVFNYWMARSESSPFNNLGLLDFVGNVSMLALCIKGWELAIAEERRKRQ